jgi:hypothetical protein
LFPISGFTTSPTSSCYVYQVLVSSTTIVCNLQRWRRQQSATFWYF